MTAGINAEVVRRMDETGVSIEDFFNLDTAALSNALGLGHGVGFERAARDEARIRARHEMAFMDKHKINALFINDDDYPFMLRETPDAPVLLYCLGNPDFHCEHIINMVGTRKCTQYGSTWCHKAVEELAAYFPDLTVVSGLAYGIDSEAHKAALENNIRTVAVVAHGLDTIYPSGNRDLARRIVREGGVIISEYPSGTTAYPQRFLERNRIVAGLCEMTVVVESPIKGGAMNTANTAFGYGRDVGALPGRVSDVTSGGCNQLIRKNKATLITCAADVIELLGWRPAGIRVESRQRNLFPELTGDSSRIYEALKFEAQPLSVDGLHIQTGLPVPSLMSALTELEFDGIIIRLPGNRYTIS